MLIFLFDKTHFFQKTHFFINLMLWLCFLPVSNRILYQKTQPSTKGLPFCPSNPSHSISEAPSINTMLKNLLSTSHSYFIYKN